MKKLYTKKELKLLDKKLLVTYAFLLQKLYADLNKLVENYLNKTK